jgi:hypothetical protein
MEHALPLAGWENFYVIVGSSAAALTGLQFVVMTLIGVDPQMKTGNAEIRVFGTPTVVHFCSVLVVAAILTVPWRTVSHAATALGIGGGLGVLYAAAVMARVRRRMTYTPVLEDWIFHAVLPMLAYATVLVAAVLLTRHPESLLAIGGASLMLLLVGIHNAWDSVTYITIDRRKEQG